MHDELLPRGTCDYVSDEILAHQSIDNASTFAELYRRHVTAIYRYCALRLPTPHDAVDATSQTFLQAFAKRHQFSARRPFRAWLFTIARHVTADVYRTRPAPTTRLDFAKHVIDPEQSPEDASLMAETQREVHTLLQQLPTSQRHLVELRSAGLSTAEIADVLGRTQAAVKIGQFRAYRHLRTLFGISTDPSLPHGFVTTQEVTDGLR
jgi:RNA polymerase sigma-70 factor (ECF subfamily)